ncbi:ABC transporter permease [Acetobacter tropicalis]|uniref:Dipeptide transport system permease protein DppC n=1 Tax=Acetobacter tropicalis TaxID=104102 RepID=A0A094YK91_9PROT|nr:ABC transporter permease [Acetobacter tropicalis]KAA8383592.1 ABC transporter permease [Acetobacter tropicalis]KAA8389375.1 ABC transporter permease [Acetobacter tropicalis]KGB21069.1 Dipeptide transport system permease protein DppC [Acetobacter tropicalis]MBC9008712.1 ABC transporter permease [Acetobacter tropicalis]MDO8173003.1 ABC transporter permease [Acetobacter tropicalis]
MSATHSVPLAITTPARLWQPFGRHIGLTVAVLYITLLVLAAVAPHLLTHGNPYGVAPREAFSPPSWVHPLGTDQSGRDIWTRLVFGTRNSLVIGIGSILLALSVALALAIPGAFGGPVAEQSVKWIFEILFSFPSVVLALLLTAIFSSGTFPLIIAVGIGAAPGYGRMLFGQFLAIRNASFIEAARSMGHSPSRILRSHLIPNAFRPLLIAGAMGVGQTIIWASALSFLGLGAPPPAAEWGTMLSMGRDYIAEAWWITFFPGVAIVLTMLATTTIGRFLKTHFETNVS